MLKVEMNEAKENLAHLIDLAIEVETVILARSGEATVRFVPTPKRGGFASLVGAWEG